MRAFLKELTAQAAFALDLSRRLVRPRYAVGGGHRYGSPGPRLRLLTAPKLVGGVALGVDLLRPTIGAKGSTAQEEDHERYRESAGENHMVV
jgi:hypothetical protein